MTSHATSDEELIESENRIRRGKGKDKQYEPSWAEYHAMVRLRKLGWRITRGKPGHMRVIEQGGRRSREQRFSSVLRWAQDFDQIMYQGGEE